MTPPDDQLESGGVCMKSFRNKNRNPQIIFFLRI